MKDSVSKVVSLALADTSVQLIERTNQQCEFSYRDSIFKRNAASRISEVILEVVFELQSGDGALLRAAVDEKIAYRQQRQPLEYPNVGSIFKNIDVRTIPAETLKQFEAKIKTDPFPVLPTAVLISAAGLKGFRVGGAMVSEKHANFIVNVGGATASDVKAVMAQVKLELKKQFGVEVEQEVIFV
jgi:UDP-N-acetylmuramate dehydrogenase